MKQRSRMVKLHIKRGDESQFLVETTVEIPVSELIVQLVRFYNGRLKVDRLCQGETPEGNLEGRAWSYIWLAKLLTVLAWVELLFSISLLLCLYVIQSVEAHYVLQKWVVGVH